MPNSVMCHWRKQLGAYKNLHAKRTPRQNQSTRGFTARVQQHDRPPCRASGLGRGWPCSSNHLHATLPRRIFLERSFPALDDTVAAERAARRKRTTNARVRGGRTTRRAAKARSGSRAGAPSAARAQSASTARDVHGGFTGCTLRAHVAVTCS